MKKQTEENKIKVNSWVTITITSEDKMNFDKIEIGKVLAIENNGELLNGIGKIKNQTCYLIKNAHGIEKWIRSDKIEKIFSPTALGFNKQGIINMEKTLNGDDSNDNKTLKKDIKNFKEVKKFQRFF